MKERLERLTVWVESSALADVKRISAKQDRSIGWLIRKAISEFVKREANST